MNPKIDILLAAYNGEKYLKEQIDSILNQTYTNFNLIISDDCSTDDTANILKEYEKSDSRITVLYQKKNLGFIKNFEFLLRQSVSDYFMLSDQDDVWKNNKIETSLNWLNKKKAVLVYSDVKVVDEKMQVINDSLLKSIHIYNNLKKEDNSKILMLENPATGSTILGKKEIISKCFPIPEELPMVHDWWIALMASMQGKICFIDDTLLMYRQHNNNIIGLKHVNENADYIELRNKRIEYYTNLVQIYKQNIDRFSPALKKRILICEKYFNNVRNNRSRISCYINAFKVFGGFGFASKIKKMIFFGNAKLSLKIYNKNLKINTNR